MSTSDIAYTAILPEGWPRPRGFSHAVVAVLKAAGGEPRHLVALRAYVTDIAEFNAAGKAIGEAWAATLGKHFPAMTLVQVSALIDPNAKVEIEGEAILP